MKGTAPQPHFVREGCTLARKVAARVWHSPFRRPIHTLRKWQLEQAARAYFASTPERAELLSHLSKSSSTGAGLMDYHLLHSYVLQKRPQWILELGSGATTLVLSHALDEVRREDPAARGSLVSMEDQAFYHEDVRKLIPASLAPHVSLHLSPRQSVRWRDEIPGYRYAEIPKHPYDMIFVDGPSDNPKHQTGASLDVFYLLLERFQDRPVDIIVDSRLLTCRSLQSVLPPGRLRFDELNRLGTLARVSGSELLESVRTGPRLELGSSWRNLGLSPGINPAQAGKRPPADRPGSSI